MRVRFGFGFWIVIAHLMGSESGVSGICDETLRMLAEQRTDGNYRNFRIRVIDPKHPPERRLPRDGESTEGGRPIKLVKEDVFYGELLGSKTLFRHTHRGSNWYPEDHQFTTFEPIIGSDTFIPEIWHWKPESHFLVFESKPQIGPGVPNMMMAHLFRITYFGGVRHSRLDIPIVADTVRLLPDSNLLVMINEAAQTQRVFRVRNDFKDVSEAFAALHLRGGRIALWTKRGETYLINEDGNYYEFRMASSSKPFVDHENVLHGTLEKGVSSLRWMPDGSLIRYDMSPGQRLAALHADVERAVGLRTDDRTIEIPPIHDRNPVPVAPIEVGVLADPHQALQASLSSETPNPRVTISYSDFNDLYQLQRQGLKGELSRRIETLVGQISQTTGVEPDIVRNYIFIDGKPFADEALKMLEEAKLRSQDRSVSGDIQIARIVTELRMTRFLYDHLVFNVDNAVRQIVADQRANVLRTQPPTASTSSTPLKKQENNFNQPAPSNIRRAIAE